jgi:cobalamin biosynthesis protein CobT
MGVQRALLARALKANDLDTRDSGRASGRLDMRAMSKMAAGSALVFGKRTIVEGYETDVQVLVDGSSSMSGNKMEAASTLALVVAQAASQVGVDCFVHVFSDGGLAYATKGKARPAPNKFGYMATSATGSTPLTERMIEAANMQRQRAGNKRKIMFVITDGACNDGRLIAKAAGEYVEQTIGVEIANLHIGHSAPGMFRNEVAVRPDRVNEVGLRQLTQMLERGI